MRILHKMPSMSEVNAMKFQSPLGTLLCIFVIALASSFPVQAQGVPGQGTWESTLLGRDINLNAVAATSADAVYLYDTTQNITWLRDANVNGAGNHPTALSWADNLVTGSGLTAISDWRLPSITYATPNCAFDPAPCTPGDAPSTSEMSSLFFSTLGNYVPLVGYSLSNTGSFQNVQSSSYWLSNTLIANARSGWWFDTSTGNSDAPASVGPLFLQYSAMAVRDGDVLAAVPEPETYLMLLTGLGLVGVMVRRRAKAPGALVV